MKSRKLVIHVEFGGLGDHLFHSHIPRIAKETGLFEEVFVSTRSDFRSQETKHLVWELNPFVDGFNDEPGTPRGQISTPLDPGVNLLDAIMKSYGLDDGKRMHEPEIFYKPTLIPELKNVSIYDPNYISNAGWLDSGDIETARRRNGFLIDAQMKLRNRSLPIRVSREIEARSLQHFCDIIFSCSHLYCLTTGTATLAAALGKSATIFYGFNVSSIFHHSPLHTYLYLKQPPFKFFISRLRNAVERRLKSRTKK
jgi:hypothetical protein